MDTRRPTWMPAQVTVDATRDFHIVMEGQATNGGFAVDDITFTPGSCPSKSLQPRPPPFKNNLSHCHFSVHSSARKSRSNRSPTEIKFWSREIFYFATFPIVIILCLLLTPQSVNLSSGMKMCISGNIFGLIYQHHQIFSITHHSSSFSFIVKFTFSKALSTVWA